MQYRYPRGPKSPAASAELSSMTVRRAEPGKLSGYDLSLLSTHVSKLHRKSGCLADSTVSPRREGGFGNTAVSDMKVSRDWPTSQVRPRTFLTAMPATVVAVELADGACSGRGAVRCRSP